MINPGEYNQDWSSDDMLLFNKYIIDEKEVICHWVDNGTICNGTVKGKDFKVHLHHNHGVTSESQMYPCRWHGCSDKPMKRSSLERHMRERHVPVKWACPHCSQTFTRDATLTDHIGRNHGHPALAHA